MIWSKLSLVTAGFSACLAVDAYQSDRLLVGALAVGLFLFNLLVGWYGVDREVTRERLKRFSDRLDIELDKYHGGHP